VAREAAPTLFDAEPEGRVAAAGPAHVASTDSRLLFQTLDGIYACAGSGYRDTI
jgi:hypothetical protein